MQDSIAAMLRRLARTGVRNFDTTRRQAELLLSRQLRQLPRWLQQDRDNGPPPAGPDGKPLMPARYYANHPAISADGSLVAFESYQPDNCVASRYGEIRVDGWSAGAPRATAITRPRGWPWSAFNPAVSADGSVVAYETSAGNRNFGKRYGGIDIDVLDRRTGRVSSIPNPTGRTASEYQPSISGDGRLIAYEAGETVGRNRHPGYAVRTRIYDRLTHRTLALRRSAPGDPDGGVWESRLSADGRFLRPCHAPHDAGQPRRRRVRCSRRRRVVRPARVRGRALGRVRLHRVKPRRRSGQAVARVRARSRRRHDPGGQPARRLRVAAGARRRRQPRRVRRHRPRSRPRAAVTARAVDLGPRPGIGSAATGQPGHRDQGRARRRPVVLAGAVPRRALGLARGAIASLAVDERELAGGGGARQDQRLQHAALPHRGRHGRKRRTSEVHSRVEPVAHDDRV
jgi:hypothetical protein